MKNVLITGISGFVGTNLVNYFSRYNQIKLFGYGRTKVNGISFLEDCSAQTLDKNKIDVVIHLAGIAHDLGGKYKPEDYYRVNHESTNALVNEVLKSAASKFIFVSSIKAVCDTATTPADETLKPKPVTDYGKSKLMAEEYIQSKAWGSKSYYILRPAMIHGPGNKGNLNLLYRFAKTGLPFPFGSFYNQRSFLGIDNFCFVTDQLISKPVSSGIYHLADDHFMTTVELYELIATTLKKKPRVWYLPESLLRASATLLGKKQMLSKLTENMVVSNKKIVSAIASPLPLGIEQGLTKTIISFDGK